MKRIIVGLALIANLGCHEPKDKLPSVYLYPDLSPNGYCTVDYFTDQANSQEPNCYRRMQRFL